MRNKRFLTCGYTKFSYCSLITENAEQIGGTVIACDVKNCFCQVIAVLLNESKRGKVVYRSESIVSLADAIHSTKVDRIGLFWDLVSPILQVCLR